MFGKKWLILRKPKISTISKLIWGISAFYFSTGYAGRDVLMQSKKMAAISSALFPDLAEVQKKDFDVPNKGYKKIKGFVRQGQTAMKVFARPLSDEFLNPVEEISDKEFHYEVHSIEGAKEAIQSARESAKLLEEENETKEFPKYPIVTFLGTGSTSPSKYRNVSAILLETSSGHTIQYQDHYLHIY
jgi:hypothetical protein